MIEPHLFSPLYCTVESENNLRKILFPHTGLVIFDIHCYEPLKEYPYTWRFFTHLILQPLYFTINYLWRSATFLLRFCRKGITKNVNTYTGYVERALRRREGGEAAENQAIVLRLCSTASFFACLEEIWEKMRCNLFCILNKLICSLRCDSGKKH